jgi:hypothetical protein
MDQSLPKEKSEILSSLAKELGYKDFDELKEALGKEEAGRARKGTMGNIGGPGGAGTGFLGGREVGSGFGVGVKKRLASGTDLTEAITGGFSDFKKTLTLENIKKRSLEKSFGGSGFVSSFARGKLKKSFSEKEGEEKDSDSKTPEKVSKSSDSVFQKMFESSGLLSQIAKDTNLMNLNLQELVKIWGGKEITEAEKDKSFFEEQDKKEEQIEASRLQKGEKSDTTPKQIEEKSGGTIATLIKFFITRFFVKKLLGFFKFLFNPKTLFKLLTKVLVPLAIIGSLFSGVMDGFKKYQETGSFTEAIIAALKGVLTFIPNLIFGKEITKKLFDSISNFFEPITSTISNIFGRIKDFFIKLFGGQVEVKDESKKEADKVTPEQPAGKVGAAGTDGTAGKVGAAGTDGTAGKVGAAGTDGTAGKVGAAGETKSATSTEPTPQSITKTPTDIETKPKPSKPTKSETKVVEKVSGTKIKLPSGVRYDNLTKSMIYKGIYFTAHAQEDLDKMVKAIDDKASIEFQGKDESGKDVTIKFDGASGSQLISAGKPSASPSVSSGSSVMGGSVGAAGGESSGGSSSGGGSVSAAGGESSGGSVSAAGGGESSGGVSAAPTTPSGGDVSAASSEVAESQRMESAADSGSVVNAPTTNNSSSSQQSGKSKPANVYDDDLITTMSSY